MFNLSLLYPSLKFDVILSLCVCVCVCVCERAHVLECFWISLTVIFPLYVCECGSWGFLCVYMWQCGLKLTGNLFPNSFCRCISIHISICMFVYVYIYIYICVCVCVFPA